MDLLYTLLQQLSQEADTNNISLEKLLDFLGLDKPEDSQLQSILANQDLISSEERLLEIWGKINQEKNSKKLVNNISRIIINSLLKENSTPNSILADKITNYIYNDLRTTKKKFAEEMLSKHIDGGMSSSDFTKLLKGLKKENHNFHVNNLKKIKIIEDIIDENKVSNTPAIESNHIYDYLLKKIAPSSLSVEEIEKIKGNYIIFSKSNYVDNHRALSISSFTIFECKKGVLRFHFPIVTQSKITNHIDGFLVRDSNQSIKFCGFYKNGQTQEIISICDLAISISVDALINGKQYLNGGLLIREELSLKPYHTWIHLSKIHSQDIFLNELSKGVLKVYEGNYLAKDFNIPYYSFKKSISSFSLEDETSHIINNLLIKNGYEEDSPIDYISNKLYLKSSPPLNEL